MGLDMFLYGVYKDKRKDVFEPSSGKWEECCYWRKANQIHKWFSVRFIKEQDPWGLYEVSEEEIQGLLLLCKMLKVIKDNTDEYLKYIDTNWFNYINKIQKDNGYSPEDSIAFTLLPPDNIGCFFGSGDVDEGYWRDIENTIEQLESALKKNYDRYYYRASW